MNKHHIRNYLELFHVFIFKQVAFSELRSIFHVTLNTVKKDISVLQTIAHHYGTKLEIVDNTISYNIIDQEVFSDIINECCAFYNKNIRRPRNLILRVTYIADRLINAQSTVSIETIADELGYSRSNLRNDMRFIRNIFTSYNLEMLGIPYAGIVIEGQEIAKRYALTTINLRCNTAILADSSNETLISEQQRNNYRKIIYDVLDTSNFVISISEKRRVLEYILIQIKRINAMQVITEFDKQHTQALLNSEEWQLAHSIYEKLNFTAILENDNEVLSLALLLAVYRDFSAVYFNNSPRFAIECNQLCNEIIAYLKNVWHIDLSEQLWFDALYIWVMNIVYKYKFGLLTTYHFPYFGIVQNYYNYPIISKISYEITRILSRKYKITVHRTQIYEISNIINLYLEEVKFNYRLPNIAISFSLNKFYNQLQLKHINRVLGPDFYESIEVINLNNIYDEVYEKYDMIITDTNLIFKDMNKPALYNTNNNLFDHFELMKSVVDYISIKDDIFFDEIIVLDLDEDNVENIVNEMLKVLDKYALPTDGERKNIQEKIYKMQDYKGSLHYIHYNTKQTGSVLLISKLGENCKFEEMKIDRMFMLIFDVTEQRLKYYNYLTALMCTDEAFFKAVHDNPDNRSIYKAVDQRIKLKLGVK